MPEAGPAPASTKQTASRPVTTVTVAFRATHSRIASQFGVSVAVLAGLLAVGEYCIGLAFTALPASTASPIVSSQSIVAVLLGGFLLNEGQFATRVVAAVIAVVGIGLVTVP